MRVFRSSTPFEFGAEDVEETVGAEAKEADAEIRAATGDAVAAMDLDRFLTIDGKEGLAGNAFDMNAYCGLAGTTIGRMVSRWGQIGVTTMAFTLAITMGPLAASEYAVEPVGVETMTPSARNVATN